MLYCVMVESGRRSWGHKDSVDASSHQVWDVESEEKLEEYTWEAQENLASSYDQEGTYMCGDCGNEQEDESECDTCESTNVDWENTEDYSEFVENNSHSHYEKYDAANPEHAACKNENKDMAERPEHVVAVAARLEEKKQAELQTIEWQIEREYVELRKITERIRVLKRRKELL
jgi:hypothetical protein